MGRELFGTTKKLVMSSALSDYDVISSFRLSGFTTRSIEGEVFVAFLFLNQLSSDLVRGLRIGC